MLLYSTPVHLTDNILVLGKKIKKALLFEATNFFFQSIILKQVVGA